MDERVKRIADGLMQLLDAIERHDSEREKGPSRVKPVRLDEYKHRVQDGEVFLSNPVRRSLCSGVRTCGELLAKEYDLGVLLEVSDVVGDTDNRMGIIDKQWDGLTATCGGVWAA